MLEIKNVSKTYWLEKGMLLKKTAPRIALENVSMKFSEGEIVAIVGESGSGKTTLARIAAGLEEPDTGEVLIDGRRVGAYSSRLRARYVGIAFQDPYSSMNPMLTVGHALREALAHRVIPEEETPGEFRTPEGILEVFSLDAKTALKRPGELSGGQLQRAALARSFAAFPEYFILDEVTSSLDVCTAAGLLKLFRKLNKKYFASLIFITHDLVLAGSVCERIYVMKSGSVVETGPTDEVFENPHTDYVKQLREAVI